MTEDMAVIRINEKLKKRGKQEVRLIPQASDGARIKVLVGTCAHCMKLHENTLKAMHELGYPESEMETISDLVTITRMGIVATPALIVDGKLLCSGKVLSPDEIKELIKKED